MITQTVKDYPAAFREGSIKQYGRHGTEMLVTLEITAPEATFSEVWNLLHDTVQTPGMRVTIRIETDEEA